MKKAQIEQIKDKLIKEKKALEKEVDFIENGILRQSQQEASGELPYTDSEGDRGSITFERERDLTLDINVKDILSRVNNALERIDLGTYGKCAKCGKDIQEGRLEVLPYTDSCISCKEDEEQGITR